VPFSPSDRLRSRGCVDVMSGAAMSLTTTSAHPYRLSLSSAHLEVSKTGAVGGGNVPGGSRSALTYSL
jgi:hypothetical protein